MTTTTQWPMNMQQHIHGRRSWGSWDWGFNDAADISYGLFCCLCFLIGTFGNVVSFVYFISKKKDISNVIYIMVTGNDIVISLMMLPMGISYLSMRRPGIFFGSDYGCDVWYFLWNLSLQFSIFLTICLSVCRTISLYDPFRRQKIRSLIIAVVIFLTVSLAKMIVSYIMLIDIIEARFDIKFVNCIMKLIQWNAESDENSIFISNDNFDNVFFQILPAFVVAISSAVSVAILTRKNENVQQRELQQSRDRATVTILLFAMLYEVCNIPNVVNRIFVLHVKTSGDISDIYWYFDMFEFDKYRYFANMITYLLLGANSAANPVLYFWRMPNLREQVITGIMRLLNRGSGPGGPVPNNRQQQDKNAPVRGQEQAGNAPVRGQQAGNAPVRGQEQAGNAPVRGQQAGNAPVRGQEQAGNAPVRGQQAGNAPVRGQEQEGNAPVRGQEQEGNAPVRGQEQAGNAPVRGQEQAGNAPVRGQEQAGNAPDREQQAGNAPVRGQEQAGNAPVRGQQAGNAPVRGQEQEGNAPVRGQEQAGNAPVRGQQAGNAPVRGQQAGNAPDRGQQQAGNAPVRGQEQAGNAPVRGQEQAGNAPIREQQAGNGPIRGQEQAGNGPIRGQEQAGNAPVRGQEQEGNARNAKVILNLTTSGENETRL